MGTMAQAFLKAKAKGDIDPQDVAYFEEFIDEYATLEDLSEKSIYKYELVAAVFLSQLKNYSYTLQTLDRKGVLKMIKWLKSSKWGEETRESYWWRFGRMYKSIAKKHSFKKNGAYELLVDPEEKYRYKVKKDKVVKKGILLRQDMAKLLMYECELAYKVFFAVLYETGMRAGEIFSLRIRDVKKMTDSDPHYYMLAMQKSKTKLRDLPSEEFSKKYMDVWLMQHPQRDNPDAPLFMNASGKPLKMAMANKRLRRLVKLAGIDQKKISLHSCRHGRATEMAAEGRSEAEMCRYFGWTLGSNMPRVYIREQQIDVLNVARKTRGVKVNEERASKPTARECRSCGHPNSVDAEYCDICKLPLDPERYKALRRNMDNEQLVKKYVDEKWGAHIAELKAEFNAKRR